MKGDTREQRDLAVHRQLATEVANVNANPPDVVPRDAYLFSIQDMSKKRLHYMQHWLQAVQAASAKEQVRAVDAKSERTAEPWRRFGGFNVKRQHAGADAKPA